MGWVQKVQKCPPLPTHTRTHVRTCVRVSIYTREMYRGYIMGYAEIVFCLEGVLRVYSVNVLFPTYYTRTCVCVLGRVGNTVLIVPV